MMNANLTQLVCKRVLFYAPTDEDMFFEWIKRIKCIEDFEGIGDELHLYINAQNMTLEDLWSLKGLFKRYKIPEEQLTKLESYVSVS